MTKNVAEQPLVDPAKLSGTFKERLYQARRTLGWSQSELARRVWGTTTDARGYEVAHKRDRISSYEKGRSIPEMENLLSLAEALGLDPAVLAPDIMTTRAERGLTPAPAVQMTMLTDRPGQVHLRVDTVLPLTVAVQILALLDT